MEMKMTKCFKRMTFILCLYLFFSMMILPNTCRAEIVIIPVQFRNVSELLPIVEGMLSKDGKISIDERANSLIIIDNDESIQNIRGFLARFDRPARQARIRLRFHEIGSSEDRSFSVDGSVSGKGWRISKGKRKKDGIDIRLRDREQRQQGQSEFFVNVISGSWAYIMVGKDIPYRERWVYLSRRYAGYESGVVFQSIESGMEVRPVIVGNRADIEIIPRISHEVSGREKGIIRFTRASTRLSVCLGQWINIGGADEESNEVMKAILESGTGKQGSSISIFLMVEGY